MFKNNPRELQGQTNKGLQVVAQPSGFGAKYNLTPRTTETTGHKEPKCKPSSTMVGSTLLSRVSGTRSHRTTISRAI